MVCKQRGCTTISNDCRNSTPSSSERLPLTAGPILSDQCRRIWLMVSGPVVLHVAARLLREIWVVPPVGLHHDGVVRLLPTQERIDGISRQLRIPRCPDLAARLTDGRSQQVERYLPEVLRLFNPCDV